MQDGDGERYPPIRDYGIIGDCHGSALIERHGRIDWCCLGRHDAEPTFCRLLDADRGGFWSLRPVEAATVEHGYRQDTNILETRFSTTAGSLTVTDLMPVGRDVEAGARLCPADRAVLADPSDRGQPIDLGQLLDLCCRTNASTRLPCPKSTRMHCRLRRDLSHHISGLAVAQRARLWTTKCRN